MGRPPKLTKFSVEYVLANSRSVTGAAAYAGVNRRSFQRAMQRFGIAFDAPSDRFAALLEPVAAKRTPTTEPEPVAIPNVQTVILASCGFDGATKSCGEDRGLQRRLNCQGSAGFSGRADESQPLNLASGRGYSVLEAAAPFSQVSTKRVILMSLYRKGS
jgi:hypothetical protein